MLLLGIISFELLFAVYFYCQAVSSGLGCKRWACAGLCFGPFIWPMFCMKKRMKVNRMFGFNYSLLNA